MMAHDRYDNVAIALHWLTALAILSLLGMGWTMTSLKPGSALQFSLYQWHKSVGITVLGLSLIRLGWRLCHRPPALPVTMPGWEKLAARLGHLGLYGLLFLMPVTGWLVVSSSPFNIPTVLYGLLSLPHLPVPAEPAAKAALNGLVKSGHHLGALLMVGLLAAHIGAALRHHLLLRDRVLVGMLPRFGRARDSSLMEQPR